MLLAFPFLSSLLFIISFPFNTSGYIAYVAFVPLFIAVLKSSDITKTVSSGAVFGFTTAAYLSIPLYYSITLNPSKGILLPVLLICGTVILPNMVIYGLFALIYRWSTDTTGFFKITLPPSAWIIIDYLRELFPFTLPWGLAGYTQVETPFIQIADIGGIHGVTFFVILINTLFAAIINSALTEKDLPCCFKKILTFDKSNMACIFRDKKFSNFLIIIFLIISVLAYGVIRKNIIVTGTKNSKSLRYLIVQGNSGSIDRWEETSSMARYQLYTRMTEKEIAESDIIVWPETVLNSADKINMEIMSAVSSLLNDTAFFVTGALRRDPDGSNYNSIFVMKKDGLQFIYDKKILFPYSERSFFGNTAGRFLNSPDKFKEGTSPDIYSPGNVTAGFSICFESIYPSVIRQQVRSGASILINVANDSWFGQSSVPYLQKYAVITRAIENRISIVRAANSGVSFAVSPAGDIITEIPFNTQNVSWNLIPVCRGSSIYTATGNWIIILSVLVIICSLIYEENKKNKIN